MGPQAIVMEIRRNTANTRRAVRRKGSARFSHAFTRKERAGKCWTCGNTLHQQTSCLTKQKTGSPLDEGLKVQPTPQVASVITESAPASEAAATNPTTSTASPTSNEYSAP